MESPTSDPNTVDAAPNQVEQQTWDEAIQPNNDLQSIGTGLSAVGKPLQSTNFVEGTSGWRLDSNGRVQAVGFEGTNVKILQTFTAAESLTAGRLVGLDWEGKVAEALRTWPDDATNQPGYADLINVHPYKANKFVVTFRSSGASDFFKAAVATVNAQTNDISFGTATTVMTNASGFYTIADSCRVDTDTYVIITGYTGGSEFIYAAVFTLDSSDTITAGSRQTVSTVDNISHMACCKADTLKFAWCGYRASFGDTSNGYATVSGTTITVATESTSTISNITNTGSANPQIRMTQVGTNKVAIMQGINGYVAIATTDGSWVVGTPVDISAGAGNDIYELNLVSASDDSFAYHLGSKIGYVTISGTTPSLSGSEVTRAGQEGCIFVHGGVIYDLVTGNQTADSGLFRITNSGGVTTATRLTVFDSVGDCYAASDGTFMFGLKRGDLGYFLSTMSNNFIGVAQDAVSRGETASILIKGVDSNQSGLIPGSHYLINDGALSILSPTVTVNTLDDVVNVVKAISSTQILI